jgi:hypothetical protein
MYADWVSTADNCGAGDASFLTGTPTVSSELGPVWEVRIKHGDFSGGTYERPQQRLESC